MIGRVHRFGRATRQALLGTLVAVETRAPVAALTFDDGPDPDETPPLLDLLARHSAKATFFLIGARAARHPEIVARIAAEGHAIGNHSWDHPSFPRLSGTEIERQLRQAEVAIGPSARRLVRPPYGDQSLASYLHLRRRGGLIVGWSVSVGDWLDDDAGTLAARLRAQLHPGAIVLLHDTLFTYADPGHRDREPMRGAVARFLAEHRDWRFVTVPELLVHGRPRRRYWVRANAPAELDRLLRAPLEAAASQESPVPSRHSP
jgi:peptidoglycan-N-acetylglucosamine deacetylase